MSYIPLWSEREAQSEGCAIIVFSGAVAVALLLGHYVFGWPF